MTSARLRSLALTSLLATAVLGACTSGGDGASSTPTSPPTPTGASGGSGAVASDVGNVSFVPGEFQYSFNSITAHLSMKAGTLEVKNASGAEVGAPSLKTVTGDDRTVALTVVDPAPIPDGGDQTFKVTFPKGIDDKTVGLIILTLGADNYGAMAPVEAAA